MRTLLVLVVLALTGCKASQWNKKKNDDTAATDRSLVTPQRVGGSDAAAVAPVSFELDPQTGRIKSVLVLRLDYFPNPQSGSATLPACFAPFPPTFAVGEAQCNEDPTLTTQVLAANVDQDCYTNPDFSRKVTTTPVAIPGCALAHAKIYAFDPSLRLDVELR